MRARFASVLIGGLLASSAWVGWQSPLSARDGSSHVLPPGASESDSRPSPVIFPRQSLPLNFDHSVHAKKLGLACSRCHTLAAKSTQTADRLLPEPAICDACHATDHRSLSAVSAADATTCSLCHVGHRPGDGNRVARVIAPSANLRFSHAAHARRNINCQQCHGAVESIGKATVEQMPRMRGCLRCHGVAGPARGDAGADCAVCHLTVAGGSRLMTRFPTGEMLPPRWLHAADHGPGWLERHKEVAAANSTFCSTCHEESECIACHNGQVRPRQFHPNDWLSLHAIASQQNSPICTDCHRQQSFCLGCHQRAGLTQTGPAAKVAAQGRFHPPRSVWTEGPLSAGHHGWEAQRNLDACVSCHTERDCVSCHATSPAGGAGAGGRRLNPHPPGFGAACRTPFRKNPRPCLTCHAPNDQKLARCQ